MGAWRWVVPACAGMTVGGAGMDGRGGAGMAERKAGGGREGRREEGAREGGKRARGKAGREGVKEGGRAWEGDAAGGRWWRLGAFHPPPHLPPERGRDELGRRSGGAGWSLPAQE